MLGLLLTLVSASVHAQHQDYGSGPLPKDTIAFTGLAQAPEANLFVGAATTSIGIQVPPGRKNLTPQIVLTYSSAGGPSPYGYGWDLPLGRIQRSTAYGVLTCANLTHQNDFVLVVPGASLEFTRNSFTGKGTPRVQETFVKIQHQAASNSWEAWDKSGIKYTFGDTAATRTGSDVSTILTPTDCFVPVHVPRSTFAWMLTRMEDPNGNRIDIEYLKDSGVLYPERVQYGGHATGFTHKFEVDFVWVLRSLIEDELVTGLGGFAARLRYRLDRIDVRHPVGGTLVRRYRLAYETQVGLPRIGRQTFLSAVTLYDRNDQALARYDGAPASSTFLYKENAGAQFAFGVAQNAPKPPAPPGLLLNHGRHSHSETTRSTRDIFDITGDGIADWIVVPHNSECLSDPFWYVYRGTTGGFATAFITWDAPDCFIRDGVASGDPKHTYTTKETLDLDGDGIPDFIDTSQWTSGGPNWDVRLGYVTATGGGFAAAVSWPSPRKEVRHTVAGLVTGMGYSGAGSYDLRDLIDINGDGLPDLVEAGSATGDWTVWLNTGSGFSTTGRVFPTGLTGSPLRYTNDHDEVIAVHDMNGDGLPDLVFTGFGNVTWPGYWYVYLNTGDGVELEEHWTLPAGINPIAGRPHMRRMSPNFDDIERDLLDLNADGLPDLVETFGWSTSSQLWKVVLNRGNGFSQTVLSWTSPMPTIREGHEDGYTWTDTFDIDGDGLPDHVDFRLATIPIYRSAGGAWCASSNGTTCASTAAAGVAPSPDGLRPDLLVQLENGIGGTTDLEYRPSTQWDNSAEDGIPDLPFTTWTVTRIERDDGLCDAEGTGCVSAGAHTLATDITYLWGRFDWVEREFRGFAIVFPTQDAPGLPREGQVLVYHQDAARSGKTSTVSRYDANAGNYLSAPLSSVTNTWVCANPTTSLEITCPAHPSGDAWLRLKTIVERTYTNFQAGVFKSVITENIDWHQCGGAYYGNVAHTSRGDPSGTPRVHTHTEYACLNTSTDYIVDKPTHLWVNNSSDSTPPLEEKWFFYDNSTTLGSLTNGNVTQVESWLDQWTGTGTPVNCTVGTKQCVYTFMTYDAYGNIRQIYDALAHETDTTYDTATQIYPVVVTSPLTHRRAFEYDPGCGALLSESIVYTGDTPPAEKSRRKYDTFCRLEKTANPNENIDSGPHEQFFYSLGGPQQASTVTRAVRETAAPLQYLFTHWRLDALGRPLQQHRYSVVEGNGKWIVNTTEYDTRGYGDRQYAPFTVTTLSPYVPLPPGTPVTTSLYDALGRVALVTRTDGSMTVTEHGEAWRTTFKDACYVASGCTGGKTVEIRDALGRVVEKQWYEEDTFRTRTVYDYDELGRLRVTRQGSTTSSLNESTRITITYDTLGRKTQTVDPDSGTWTYGYDRAGNLKFQDDPKLNQHLQYCYDAGNRVTRECPQTTDYSGTLVSCSVDCTNQVRSCYDTQDCTLNGSPVPYGLGRLTKVNDPSGETRVEEYDVRGRLRQVTKEIDAFGDGQNVTMATTRYDFDDADHLTRIIYPDDEEVQYGYDEAGQLTTMHSATYNVDYVAAATYDLFGRSRLLDHGNGTQDRRTYDGAANNFRLASLSTYAGINARLVYNYPDYTATGLLGEIVDAGPKGPGGVMDTSATFTYDGLGRLTGANGPRLGTLAYGYDYLGNLTAKEGTTFSYLSAKPHTLWKLDGSTAGLAHDDNGNRTGKLSQTFAYDHRDRLTAVNDPSGGVDFRYDYRGRRVVKIVDDETVTAYYSELFESSGGWVTKYYFAGDRLIATRRAQTPGFAALGDPAVQLAAVSFSHPAVVLILRQDVQHGGMLAGMLLASVLLLVPARRKRVVGIALRHGHVIGVAAAFTLGTFPWPLLVRPAAAQCPPPPPAPVVFHYHLDHLGSTVLVTDSTGAAIEYVRYKPYGEVRQRYDGSGAGIGPSELHRYEFTGYESDSRSGLQYAGARFYDPGLGMFLTHDPARQFHSPYAYGPWSPLNGTDPNGELWPALIPIILGVLAVAAVGIDAGVKSGDPLTGLKASGVTLAAGSVPAGTSYGLNLIAPRTFGKPDAGAYAISLIPIAGTVYGAVQSFKHGNYASGVVAVIALAYSLYALHRASQRTAADSVIAEGEQFDLRFQGPTLPQRVWNSVTAIGNSIADDLGAAFQGIVGNAYGLVTGAAKTLYGLGTGNLELAGQGLATFGKALILRYGNLTGPDWPGQNRLDPFANKVDQGAFVHDSAYARIAEQGGRYTRADLALIRDVWVGPGIEPGPIGQVYRILLTGAFGAKVGLQAGFGF